MKKILGFLILFLPNLTFSHSRVLNIGSASEPRDLDPQLCSGANETRIVVNLFEGLVGKDPRYLRIIPGVSYSWKVSKDGLKYSFQLRKDAFWSNGAKVTAQDFVYSWTRLLTPSTAAEFSSFGFYFKNGKAYYEGKIKQNSELGFKAIDEHHLEVILENPNSYFLSLLAHPALFPVPRGAVEKFGVKWSRPEHLVSNGPFVVGQWRTNELLELKKNAAYWDVKNVRPDQVNVRFVAKSETEERMFRAGKLDVTAQVPIEKIPFWEKEKTGALQKHPYLGVYFFWLNVATTPLDNLLVRKALNLAINREDITHKVIRVNQIEAQFFTPPGTGGFYPEPILPKDGSQIKKAKELLARAGYPDGKGFPKLELLYNTDEGHKKIAESVQHMWKDNLGIEVSLVNQEWKVLLDTQNLKNFTILRGGWVADYNDPSSFLEIFTTGNSNNHVSWSSTEFDQKMAAALREKQLKKRNVLFQSAENILLDQLPIIPIYIYTRVYLKNPKLEGWFPNIEDYRTYKGVYLK